MNNNGDKEQKKCDVLLFTCCFSRSFHLELTTDISSKTFLFFVSLKKIISKHGCPKIIVSDNFRSFKPPK